jgi:multidrug efflux system membrane fusion protein
MNRILGVWLVLAALGAGCSKAGGGPGAGVKPKGPLAFPVRVAQVESRELTYAVRATGGLEAFERIQITARVAGVVDAVKFAEGDVVRAGQVLVEIDAARYRIALRQAKAALDKAEASVGDAKAGLERRLGVNREAPGTIREDELETYRTRLRTGEADVALARAGLEQAEVNLRDALVRAPIAGAIETRTVETGTYVQPGNAMATMLRREPLLLRFDVPEDEAQRIRVGQRVEFEVRGGLRPFRATIMQVSDAANATSRLVRVTGRVDDPERRVLRPGSFAQVRVPVGGTTSPVIPQTAVRPSERGFLAFVVEDGKARERVLQLGLRTDDGMVEVLGGVSPGDTLVTRGAEALKDGASVNIVKDGPPGLANPGGRESPASGAPPGGTRP